MLFLGAAAARGQTLSRVPAATLQLPPEPPPTQFTTVRAFPDVAFTQPLALVTPPGESRRLFVVEKTGRIWVIPDVSAASPTRTLFLDLSSRVAVSGDLNDERGLLALAFHPRHASNGLFYVWYTLNTTTGAGSGLHNRLARFRVSSADPAVADAASEQPLLTQRDEAGNHNGGELLFGPDGYLYLSLGDEGGANDQFQNSQRIDRDFFAGIIRIDVDQRPGSLTPNPHPAVHAGTYAIPPDNPFVGATTFNGLPINPAAVRNEFWATGLRNPWRMSFDPATGNLWCADVGQNAREEIHRIVGGGNYGWQYREGSIARPGSSAPPAAATFIDPVWDYGRSDGVSVTGGLVYRGPRVPALYGHYLFADFVTGRIWSLRPDGDRRVDASRVRLLASDGGIASFGLDPSNGDILLADLTEGAIKRLVAATGSGTTPLPPTLSATGAFSDVATLTPAPGVAPYEPNVAFWSDHATKRRWFALPDATSTFGFAADGPWTLPTGAVWVKHFDVELTRGDPATKRRIETRFLIKTATGVHGLSYRWNEAQTDATLVPEEGADYTFDVVENGIVRPQTWRYTSRAECLTCHTAAGGFALSFNTRQLNRAASGSAGADNFIEALARAGYLDSPAPPAPAALPALARADDVSHTLEHRARSYLDVNCSACHQPGGPALGTWDARATPPLTATGLINGALIDDGGNPSNRVVVPGDADHSRLLQRMLLRGPGQMPPVGIRERDVAGESLLREWIAALAGESASGRLINLAARAQVGDGATLAAGFVIGPGAEKTVLVRAIGPKLADFGVSAPLAQPALRLVRDSQVLGENTRWGTAANAPAVREAAARVGAFALSDASADSALLATLPAGAYTAEATSVDNSNGIALVEVYDADASAGSGASRLINLAVRAHVGSGAAVLIPGLVINGGTRTVLIRAVGPGLAAFGIANHLAQPVLTLFAGSQPLLTNTRWSSATNANAIRSTASRVGAFALAEGSADSALLTTLPAGAYTIRVAGAAGGSGIALVEVYEVP